MPLEIYVDTSNCFSIDCSKSRSMLQNDTCTTRVTFAAPPPATQAHSHLYTHIIYTNGNFCSSVTVYNLTANASNKSARNISSMLN